MDDIFIAIVLCSSPAPPNITSVTHEAETSHLTCVSTGSPATNVTWRRNGQPLTIDGSLYQLTQTVTNRSLSTYENVLTISDIDRCSYTCTVTNALGNDSQTYCKFTTSHLNLFIDTRISRIGLLSDTKCIA